MNIVYHIFIDQSKVVLKNDHSGFINQKCPWYQKCLKNMATAHYKIHMLVTWEKWCPTWHCRIFFSPKRDPTKRKADNAAVKV